MPKRFRTGLILVLPLLVSLGAARVAAFPFPFSWHNDADARYRAGAGGIYHTGSQTDFGLTCAHCHIDGAGTIDARITSTPSLDNGYTPGATYNITLELIGEHIFPPAAEHLNGFAMMFEDQGGAVVGTLESDGGTSAANCPGPLKVTGTGSNQHSSNTWLAAHPNDIFGTRTITGTTYLYSDCKAIFSLGIFSATQWHFKWTAPRAGTGTVTGYWGLVDGGVPDISSLGDDVRVGRLVMPER